MSVITVFLEDTTRSTRDRQLVSHRDTKWSPHETPLRRWKQPPDRNRVVHPTGGAAVAHSFSSIDELGDGYGFRKVRAPLGISAFGVNAIVYPPRFEGFLHYHDTQDELYFVHSGSARFECDGDTH